MEKNIKGNTPRTIYPRIRNLREDADLSQTDIAKLLNYSQVAYSYYETGRRDIPTDTLIKLADIHHTSIDYLLVEQTLNKHIATNLTMCFFHIIHLRIYRHT